MTIWTKDEDDKLKSLRVEGYSFKEIGKRINKTRNACCSRADRIGMVIRSPARKAPPKLLAEAVFDTAKAPKGRPLVSLMDLTSTACRWPFGDPKDKDFGFCGCKCAEDKPYCDEHAARAYNHIRTEKAQKKAAKAAQVAEAKSTRWAA